MKVERTFPNEPGAVPTARRYVTTQLREVPKEILDEVGLMVSELATNCILHAATEFTVSLEQTPQRIRVEVTDGGPGELTMRSPQPTDLSGRGLRIVQQLADAFGVEHTGPAQPAGKTVWFVVQLDEQSGQPVARPNVATRKPTTGTSSRANPVKPSPRRRPSGDGPCASSRRARAASAVPTPFLTHP